MRPYDQPGWAQWIDGRDNRRGRAPWGSPRSDAWFWCNNQAVTEQPEHTSRTITQHVADTVARLRTERRMPMTELERRLADIGQPIPRLGLQRLEAGDRKVNAEEIVALARVFDVPALLLMFPFDATSTPTEILPGVVVDTRTAMKWFTGRANLGEEMGSAGQATLRLFDEHDRLFEEVGYLDAEFRLFPAAYDDPEKKVAERKLRLAVRDLRMVRAQMRQRKLQPPTLDEQLAFVDDEQTEFVRLGDVSPHSPAYGHDRQVAVERRPDGTVRPIDFSNRDD